MRKYCFTLCLMIAALPLLKAQLPTEKINIPGVPRPLMWITAPLAFSKSSSGFVINGGEKTDLFVDPQEAYHVVNAPKLVFNPDSVFLLSSRIRVAFASDYDAGVLIVYKDEKSWAKLCFELSPGKIPTVVSVVNNGKFSDDCNHSEFPDRKEIFLRIAGLGKHIYAFHYSTDGEYWNLVRYFSLDDNGSSQPIRIGFSSQSPTGKNCESFFSVTKYDQKKLDDIRSGQ
jgi:uncharacterized protein